MYKRINSLNAVTGEWLPNDKKIINNWVKSIFSEMKGSRATANDALVGGDNLPLANAEVLKFYEMVNEDVSLHILANQMFEQACENWQEDPYGNPAITNFKDFISVMDYIVSQAPRYMEQTEEGYGLLGFPLNAIVDFPMGTPAGYAFFLNEKVNMQLKNILNEWCLFLTSADSRDVLVDKMPNGKEGWLSDNARKVLNLDFYKYNDKEPYFGFKSWNDFFIREFKDGVRPIYAPDDNSIVNCACESGAYKISENIQKGEKFWLKKQEYSVEYMLDSDCHKWSDIFVGGTIFQAFLSATKYHRWHCPVNGKIVDCYNIDGTYYSELLQDMKDPDKSGPNFSQGYITHTAARCVIIIESETLGRIAFVAVGMAEVSSCKITAKVGQTIKKGDELGYFQFGGSSHCLIFEPNVKLKFVEDAIPAPDFNDSPILPVNGKLADAS
ncbi:MAG: phosphatidylserine decarboxylase family protein [Ruminococcus sp.]|jgi:phosphatidylserine decarboxylase|nr:phosphatidylserine decarboxylase family protein [Ruminococcus sp.]